MSASINVLHQHPSLASLHLVVPSKRSRLHFLIVKGHAWEAHAAAVLLEVLQKVLQHRDRYNISQTLHVLSNLLLESYANAITVDVEHRASRVARIDCRVNLYDQKVPAGRVGVELHTGHHASRDGEAVAAHGVADDAHLGK